MNNNRYYIFCDESWKKGEKFSVISTVIVKQYDMYEIENQMKRFVRSIRRNSNDKNIKKIEEAKVSFLQQNSKMAFRISQKLVHLCSGKIKCMTFITTCEFNDLEIKSQKYLEVYNHFNDINDKIVIIDNFLENQSVGKNKPNTIKLKGMVKLEDSKKYYLLQIADILSGTKRITINNSKKSKMTTEIIKLIEKKSFGAETKMI